MNKAGTHPLALAARAAGVPLFAVSDTFKLSPGPVASIAMPNTRIYEGGQKNFHADVITHAIMQSFKHAIGL